VILLPRWRWTARIMRSPFVSAAPAALYAALVLPRLGEIWPAVSRPTLSGVATLLGSPAGATIAWAHFLAFDLFVGRWIYLDSQERRVSAWLVAPVLFLSLMLGPAGLLFYLIVRSVAQVSPAQEPLQSANYQGEKMKSSPGTTQGRSRRGEVLRHFLLRALAARQALTILGGAMLITFLATLAGIFVDHRVITAAPAWLKPAKFAVSVSIYCFTLAKLWPALSHVKPNNKHREIYLTDAVSVLNSSGETVLAEIAPDPRETLGCNTRADLAAVDRTFREWKRDQLMRDGVTIQLPETVLVDPDVTIGEDTILEPTVQLLGKTKIGARCTIRTGSVLRDATLGDAVLVEPHCVIDSSRLESEVIIGPFARLRPESHLLKGAKVGNFVEIKKSTIGEGSKAPHLSYIGDAKVGSKSNIGAGTITCNYDGFAKHPTTIGNRVFVGSDTVLVAPVKLGDGAYIAAGSVITENVPPDALGIARGRQSTKPNWASRKRRELSSTSAPKKPKRKKRR